MEVTLYSGDEQSWDCEKGQQLSKIHLKLPVAHKA